VSQFVAPPKRSKKEYCVCGLQFVGWISKNSYKFPQNLSQKLCTAVGPKRQKDILLAIQTLLWTYGRFFNVIPRQQLH